MAGIRALATFAGLSDGEVSLVLFAMALALAELALIRLARNSRATRNLLWAAAAAALVSMVSVFLQRELRRVRDEGPEHTGWTAPFQIAGLLLSFILLAISFSL